MINSAISMVTEKANQFLQHQLGKDEDIVVASSLVELDGTVPSAISDKVVFTLVNIEREATFKQPMAHTRLAPSQGDSVHASMCLNLYLMVVSNFSSENYSESLKRLSLVMDFFHLYPVFDHSVFPDLDIRIERLNIQVHDLGTDELSKLWSVNGGHYQPSCVYKIRVLAIE